MVSQQYLRPPQAARFLLENYGFGAVRSLAKMRVVGGGPIYRNLGRRLVVYLRADLVAWAEAKLSQPRRSTSDVQAPVGITDKGRWKQHEVNTGRYRTLVIDPRWDGDQLSPTRVASSDFPNLMNNELFALPIADWAQERCHLYLWTSNNLLTNAVALIERWGFDHRTVLTWVKPHGDPGAYFRNQTEHVLFAIRGELHTRSDAISNVFEGSPGPRTERPEAFYDIVRQVSHAPFGEVFQRVPRPDFEGLLVETRHLVNRREELRQTDAESSLQGFKEAVDEAGP
jgi:N6-adenosine-specific RNA methylase IME4